MGWPIAIATRDSTAEKAIDFIMNQFIYSFSPPAAVISDNAVYNSSRSYETNCNLLETRASICTRVKLKSVKNGWSLKQAIAQLMTSETLKKDQALPKDE